MSPGDRDALLEALGHAQAARQALALLREDLRGSEAARVALAAEREAALLLLRSALGGCLPPEAGLLDFARLVAAVTLGGDGLRRQLERVLAAAGVGGGR